ncbi:MAG: chemoreceptor glutamine deamidase CheD [Gammaproteobacteria bacterium]|nr:chemoreceptor glutamine deamidase CheD [Gammaproteobacteria bacterium]
MKASPKILPGFEHINRYWDRIHKGFAAKILPGEYFVTKDHEFIATVLGSCVSACICDPYNHIGGMNHFLLPLKSNEKWSGDNKLDSKATRYGNFAMEHLINDIIKYGGEKKFLEVKIFGGSRIMDSTTDIGKSNIDFVRSFLHVEGLKVVAEDVGGINPRKVFFDPQTGRVKVRKLKHLHNDTISKRENNYKTELGSSDISGEVDIFKDSIE